MRFIPVPGHETFKSLLVLLELFVFPLIGLEPTLDIVERNSGLLVEFCGVFESEDKTTDLLFQHATPPCDGIFLSRDASSAPKSIFFEGIKAY
jgi:hypothetical protein